MIYIDSLDEKQSPPPLKIIRVEGGMLKTAQERDTDNTQVKHCPPLLK